MNIRQAAEHYVNSGWSVIPVSRSNKEPLIKWTEYQKRLPTKAELDEWFNKNDVNIAIVTGSVSDLGVIDADGEEGLDELGKKGYTSPVSVLTGTGKHLYFKGCDARNTWLSKEHQGLDTRGEGGYVIAPPSVHMSGKKYSWVNNVYPRVTQLPNWPVAKEVEKLVVPTVALPSTEPWLTKAMDGVGSGERHRTLVKLVCYFIPRHPREYVEMQVKEWNAKNTPPLPDSEVDKQINDLYNRFATGKYRSTFKPKAIYTEARTEALDIKSPKQGLKEYMDAVNERGQFFNAELPTGFKTLDSLIWGLRRKGIVTVGARPGTGKTSFFVNVAAHLCRLNKRVLFFSTEMGYDELYDKFLSSEAGIKGRAVSSGNFSHEDLSKRDDFIKTFETFDLHVVNLFRPDEKAVRDAVEQVNPDVLIFDHIQHIASGEHEYADISKFTKFLKEVSMQTNVAVLVASQLSRGAVADGMIPDLHHLKGCGTIEEEATTVILMHDEHKDQDTRQILFKVAKNRHGKCGEVLLTFDGDYTKFKDVE